MSVFRLYFLLLIFFVFEKGILGDRTRNLTRQKRCIVIQKQSGTHGDSTEAGDDEDYKKPQQKEPRPDKSRRLDEVLDRRNDVEDLSEQPIKYKKMQSRQMKDNAFRYLNRFMKKH